jgi:predicted kinase
MRKVIVLSGVSGSGKSTYTKSLVGEAERLSVCSADHYFMSDGVYKFDPSKLSDAHGACFRDFLASLQINTDMVVVDNTNTSAVEIAPYILGAQAFGYEVEVHTLMCETEDDVKVCAARNAHGVPFQGVMAQHKRLQERQLPPWWTNKTTRPHF